MTLEERVLAWLGIIVLIVGLVFQVIGWLGVTPAFLIPYASNVVYSLLLLGAITIALLVGRRTKSQTPSIAPIETREGAPHKLLEFSESNAELMVKTFLPDLSHLTIHYSQRTDTAEHASQPYYVVNARTNQAYWVREEVRELNRRGLIQAVTHSGKDDLLDYLKQNGINLNPHYSQPYELMTTYSGQTQTNGLAVYTRTEIEQELPFDSFISQVKRGGELMILARTFHKGSSKTGTIKRLIREQGVTVTIVMLADAESVEWHKQLMILEADFKRPMLHSDMQRAFVALCQLRRDLSDDEKTRLIVLGYEKPPFLSLIVIDPKGDGIMQIGNYMSGTDPGSRVQVVLSKKSNKDVFDQYWDEYISICEESSVIDLERAAGEFL